MSFLSSDEGWPYPDSGPEEADLGADVDDDILSLRAEPQHLLDGLDALERQVVSARFGLGGAPVRSMRELHRDLGIPRDDLKWALGSGLSKLRTNLMG